MFAKLIPGKTEYERGLHSLSVGDRVEALTLFSKAIQLNPKLIGVRRDRAKLYSESKDYRSAINDLTKELGLKQTAAIYLERSKIHELKKDYQSAIEDCSSGILLEPNNSELYYRRSNLYWAVSDYSNAMADIDTAIEYYPNCFKARIAKGVLLYKVELYEQAFVEFSLARYIDPNDTSSYLITSKIYLKQNNPNNALKDLITAEQIATRLNDPSNLREIRERIRKVRLILLSKEQKSLKFQ